MDPSWTGQQIRAARQKRKLTQAQLAEALQVSDKTVSKWERGRGCPDVSLLRPLAEVLGLELEALLGSETEAQPAGSGNLKKTRFHVCPICGNLLMSLDSAQLRCCGQRLQPLPMQKAPEEELLRLEPSDGQLLVSSDHEMTKDHHISFVALLTGDTLIVRKLYPEWDLLTRLPSIAHGTLLWYCTRHGLFGRRF